ncbi:MAG: allantoicase [Woeseia sp.]
MKPGQDNPFRQWVRLEQPRLGTRVVFATDDFFADKARLIDPAEPVFVPDKYDDNGKWMDGWESRRKREPGHDYCIVRLGVRGVIRGFDIDTSHFTGNCPPHASIDACASDEEIPGDGANWREVLPKVALAGDSHHFLAVDDQYAYTHIRLNIFPDGGVARLRVYGEVRRDPDEIDHDAVIDLLALENGGRALVCNDEHFGSMHNLNVPGRGADMGDGWETARRREPGNDWVVLALGLPGVVEKVEIDTAHFKGNYPDRAAIQAAHLTEVNLEDLESASRNWPTLLPESKLDMDRQHYFTDKLNDVGKVTHVRLSIFPDGGVSRLRIYGRAA